MNCGCLLVVLSIRGSAASFSGLDVCSLLFTVIGHSLGLEPFLL